MQSRPRGFHAVVLWGLATLIGSVSSVCQEAQSGSANKPPAQGAYAAPEPLTAEAISSEDAKGVVGIGSNRQFFVDNQVIAEAQGIDRVWHKPTKHPGNPVCVPDKPWEGGVHPMGSSVLRDPESGKFRLWYMNYPAIEDSTGICYAESDDGIHWTKPELGIFEHKGSKANNIVFRKPPEMDIKYGAFGGCVFRDEKAPPAERYKMIVFMWKNQPGKYRSDGAITDFIISSPDGIHFDYETLRELFEVRHDIVYTNVNFDRDIPYVIYQADSITPPKYRKVARYDSRDLKDWRDHGVILERHPSEPAAIQFYGMSVESLDALDVGLVNVFDTEADTIHIELGYSRDHGYTWQRVNVGEPFIGLGERPTATDWGMVLAVNNIVEVEDEYWFYYSGWDGRHDAELPPERTARLHLATLRTDGFVSLHGGITVPGTLTTKPLQVDGSKLVINAKANEGPPKGQVRVALLDGEGEPMPGYAASEMDHFRGDATAHTVTWDGSPELPDVEGEPIRLRFTLVNADLYTFAFQE